MNKDEIINKWLNHELTNEELHVFNTRKDFENERRLAGALHHFSAPELKQKEILVSILSAPKLKTKGSIFKPLIRIAAILVIGLGLFWYSLTLNTTIDSKIAEKLNIILPDNSEVVLNAKSYISYHKNSWLENRTLELNGEAFFDVEKGSSFTVKTNEGIVTVIGTEFSIKQREHIFEVICYEGTVAVNHKGQQQTLYKGDTYLSINGNLIVTEKEKLQQPAWLTNESIFKSMPYTEVLKEFERQYNVILELDSDIESNTLFTGRFTHENLDIALKSITLPLHLSYSKTDQSIILRREH
ncbi:FecR family protein [Ichthyenterobacterium sp. W332]|uniref:FecR family protein n=1 Tax=Microcosmobacter mediterraneus TaxID=3075607 RepID=A0ABU2YNA7_9FLAO|nr:FecR family protein [Ichthyenterobacterium sp. W332]MDT0559307.1 FecR family protein [Ichthyenterobacterium sp. W332]